MVDGLTGTTTMPPESEVDGAGALGLSGPGATSDVVGEGNTEVAAGDGVSWVAGSNVDAEETAGSADGLEVRSSVLDAMDGTAVVASTVALTSADTLEEAVTVSVSSDVLGVSAALSSEVVVIGTIEMPAGVEAADVC